MIFKILLAMFFSISAFAGVEETKKEIFDLAKTYYGQGDVDGGKQKNMDRLVEKLLQEAPQPPISERLDLLAGAWRQEWGPYNYQGSSRDVDPKLDKEIYQVVSKDGYYYNVVYLNKNGKASKRRIALLRGEYKTEAAFPNLLRVKFTKYPGLRTKPEGVELWELPALAEAGQLQETISIVPTWIVRTFFGGGTLREVYTDQDMRIMYGSSGRDLKGEFIYIMSRVE
jgi:hypothetical protein